MAQRERICLQYRRCRSHRLDPWVGKIPWRRAWQPAPVFLPGESHGQRSLAGYGPRGFKELDTTERLNTAQRGLTGLLTIRSLFVLLASVFDSDLRALANQTYGCTHQELSSSLLLGLRICCPLSWDSL